jgi:serine/threonine-protein phosphatase 2A activator
MLDTLDRWIEEIPPQPTPQRFGNLAFRTWGKRLQDVSRSYRLVRLCSVLNVSPKEYESLLVELLPSQFHAIIPYVAPHLLTAFGSFTRMDYGTGHETSFMLFLLGLTLVRFIEPKPEVERELVLTVFLRYLQLCWKLQDVYRLEPAGSHGVWGLDDYSFIGYIFGSAQLRG